MKEHSTLQWIKDNLSIYIKSAVEGTIFTEDWLAGMAMRETGILIMRYVPRGYDFKKICSLMRGDYSQRKDETEKEYHGFSFWQIDIASYPDFISSGDWQDPAKSAIKCVSVLNEKSAELAKYNITSQEAITAAYNCGSYGVRKGISKANDPDIFTYNHDYSKEVGRFREIYKTL